MEILTLAFSILVALLLIAAWMAIVIVPEQSAVIVERLGRYERTLRPGLNLLIPAIDRSAYRHSLKERAIDTAAHDCITHDNVQVSVDGILYLRIVDANLASYGTQDYQFAIVQLAQTLVRSEIGQLDLDRTFAERSRISACVVSELGKAARPWGIKVIRYEIQNIRPPREILEAMEKQVRAERERRAAILASEAIRDALANEADGKAAAIERISKATAHNRRAVRLLRVRPRRRGRTRGGLRGRRRDQQREGHAGRARRRAHPELPPAEGRRAGRASRLRGHCPETRREDRLLLGGRGTIFWIK